MNATTAGELEEAVRIKNELAKFHSEVDPSEEGPEGEGFNEKSLIGTEWVLVQGGEQVMFRFGESKFQAHHLDVNDNWIPGGHRNWRMENAKRRQIPSHDQFPHDGDEGSEACHAPHRGMTM